jgi:hypothetical protein
MRLRRATKFLLLCWAIAAIIAGTAYTFSAVARARLDKLVKECEQTRVATPANVLIRLREKDTGRIETIPVENFLRQAKNPWKKYELIDESRQASKSIGALVERFSDEELAAIAKGDLRRLSNSTLRMLATEELKGPELVREALRRGLISRDQAAALRARKEVEIEGVGIVETPGEMTNEQIAFAAQHVLDAVQRYRSSLCAPWDLHNLSELTAIQRQVVDARRERDSRDGWSFPALALGVIIALVGTLPWGWYFLLDRIREVANAIRG